MSEAAGVGSEVSRQRLRRGWSQEKLAVEAGVSRNTVARIEQDRPVQRGSLSLVLTKLGIQELQRPGGDLSDEELVAEVERRYPGLMDRVIRSQSSTSPPSSEERRESLGRTGEKRDEVDHGDATAI